MSKPSMSTGTWPSKWHLNGKSRTTTAHACQRLSPDKVIFTNKRQLKVKPILLARCKTGCIRKKLCSIVIGRKLSMRHYVAYCNNGNNTMLYFLQGMGGTWRLSAKGWNYHFNIGHFIRFASSFCHSWTECKAVGGVSIVTQVSHISSSLSNTAQIQYICVLDNIEVKGMLR